MLSFQTVPNDTSEEGEDDDDSGLRPQPTTSKRKRRKATIKRKLAKVRVTKWCTNEFHEVLAFISYPTPFFINIAKAKVTNENDVTLS